MIEIRHVYKNYDDFEALKDISAEISDKQVFGLIGTNGSGKSTLLRIAAGILKADQGDIYADGSSIFENPQAKQDIFYISDDQYYFSNACPLDIMEYFRTVYPRFDGKRAEKMLKEFELPEKRKVNNFSKGMKKQLSIILGLSSGCRYLLCDETFDGLDPQMRQAVKSLFAIGMEEKGLTPVIASHNLRELEDICDHIGLLHRGGILFSKDLDEMKLGIHKVQLVSGDGTENPETLFSGLEIIKKEQRGKLYTLTVRGTKEETEEKVKAAAPIFYELLPLSLEEIFISETEVNGYDIRKLLL